ncbi:LysR family transcriptional regulator [Stenotrophomonas rhizophila]|uniref:LysR family transcriptional regulator n=1 Tax=Stenotrophomonas rhizophila TaxID=216778 RepID=A0A498CHB5_9GAMM|nr:LysR family transcriptional regulator [Stenotrophomonas rhizophila]RLK56403.1 LysR family transcriptional regulator [Stenotrophomonas rhizophila]
MSTYSASRLQGISVFVQSVDAGSFTAAAQRLGVTKSAVGKSVSTLERRLGIRLLERTTRRLALTEEGSDFYQSCLKVLAELDEAEARAASRRREVAGTLRISLPVSFGRRWVMPQLLELARSHPKLRLEVGFSDRAVDLLEEGFDMVVRLGDPGNSSSLSSRNLGHQRLITCASPAYLAERGSPAHLADLAAHDCVTFGSLGRILPWALLDDTGRVAEVAINGRHIISDGEALRSAVLDGLGIAQLPTWLVADELCSGKLVAILAPQGVEGQPIQALWPATRDLAPKIRATVDQLLASFVPLAPWDARRSGKEAAPQR